jgi:hypothetical protein
MVLMSFSNSSALVSWSTVDMLKYIKVGKDIIVFPETLNHSDVARAFPDRVDSAGQCQIGIDAQDEIFGSCFGSSITLGLSADKEEDSRLLNQQLRGFW